MAKGTLDRLEKLAQSLYADSISAEDFTKAFELVMEHVVDYEKTSTKKLDKTVSMLETTIDALGKQNGKEIDSLKRECLNYVETYLGEISSRNPDMKGKLDVLSSRIDAIKQFTDADKASLKDEVLLDVLSQLPPPKEMQLETPDQTVEKINKANTQIKQSRVEGLEDSMRIVAHNAISVAPTTTVFYKNGQMVGRAKNINVQSSVSAVSISGDTATINLTAGSSGVSSVVAGTNVSVDNTDPQNPIVSATAGSGITRQVSSISSPTTAGSTASKDYVYLVSGTTTLTLPTAVGNTNLYTVKNVGVATVTIATTSAQTIDGSASATLPVANTSLDLISDGANWVVV